jgi:hypothetical protein
MTAAQKTLLLDHQHLGHMDFGHLQSLYRPKDVVCEFDGCSTSSSDSCLISSHAAISTCAHPQCLACNTAKAKRRPTGAKHTTDIGDRQDVLSIDQLFPGQRVSVDQYESSVRGRLPSTRGREASHSQYCGGTLFVDHASSCIFVQHQVSLAASDTIMSKRIVEQEARSCGVEFLEFHTSNQKHLMKSYNVVFN